MPVSGKVFSYEGNQYSFEKQLQVKKKERGNHLAKKKRTHFLFQRAAI